MENLLPRVLGKISSYLMEYKAVSSEELMWKIGHEVDSLAEDERKRLEELLQGDVTQMIFDGITGKVRLSVFSPDMHVRLNYLGEVFYCPPTHKYMPDELEKAFKRLVNLRLPKVSQIVEDTIRGLMDKSGYEVSDVPSQVTGVYKSFKAVKDGRELQLFIFPSSVFVSEGLEVLKGIAVESAVIVPSENSPAPFVNFIREHIDTVRESAEMMIWVVNVAQGTVTPLLGRPGDDEIWENFTDPEKSLQASQNWIKGAVRSRVLDEDF
ncbi:MAG: hypothetical protein ABID54_01985 [Pseudomonadota bacterium]